MIVLDTLLYTPSISKAGRKKQLLREVLPDYDYIKLEIPHIHQFATDDPKAF